MRSASLVQSDRFCVPSFPRGWFAIAEAQELPVEAREGDPQVWYDAVVQAKGGNAEAIVMLTITTPYQMIFGLGSSGSLAYQDFTAKFGERGRSEDIAVPTYVEFFADAVGVIGDTCEEFRPEG